MSVRLIITPVVEMHHTIAIAVPITLRGGKSGKRLCRQILDKICQRLELPKRAAVVRCLPRRGDYRGYVFVYKGVGTPADRERFMKGAAYARRLLARQDLTPERVR